MKDFAKLQEHCDQHSEISRAIVDEFLLYYAPARDRVDRDADERLGRYRHITSQLDPSWKNYLMSQYIVHRIFREGGLIKRYLNHAEIKRRSTAELQFLAEQSQTPWKFSFSVITGNPSGDFYEMSDVFSGESFLLYSKSVTQTLKEHPVMTWFNLISYNGHCWQSFGPVSGFQSFDVDDLFYFATELNPRIDNEHDVLSDVEKNPVPYMMLFSASETPRIIQNGYEIVMLMADYDLEEFDGSLLQSDFHVEYAHGVYRAGLNGFQDFPHSAFAYYNEAEHSLRISSCTDEGFSKLAKKLKALGFELDSEAQIRVHPSMILAIGDILNREFSGSSYDSLFSQPSSAIGTEQLEKINQLLAKALPIINAGGTPDIDALIRDSDVDPDIARQTLEAAIKRSLELRNL